MVYLDVENSEYGFFNLQSLKEKGGELHANYAAADPFPHIVFDDFCTPDILDACIDYFPDAPDPESMTFDRDQERKKTGFNPDYLPTRLRSFFYSMNSRPVIQFLENLTGIEGLLPDPYFAGGGFHQTEQGGHLGVHADFNIHKKLGIERRINLLIYLNKDWEDGFGGELELWDRQMKQCVQRIVPVFNRCVVFSTNDTSFHGHPTPIVHPRNVPRRSIALYYYTATWHGDKRAYTTQFKARPGSEDVVDWRIKTRETINEILPPIIARPFGKILRRLGL